MKNLKITLFALAIVLLSLSLVGCGGGGASTPLATQNPAQPGSLASSITLGDAPADSVVSFEITVNSISLNGGANLLSTPRRLEMTHLSATVEHLALANIPAGTYTQAQIGWSSPEVTFLDAAGVLHEFQSSSSGTATVNMNFTLSAASVLNFDIDVASSVTISGTTATFNSPVFTFMAGRGLGEAEREAESGELEDTVGTVVSASATSLTIKDSAGNNFTLIVNATTKLDGITSASQLVANQVVTVEGTIQSDGTIVAKEIESESADGNGAEAEGLVTSVGATSFSMVVDDASGSSTSSSDLGKTVTVDASSANFRIGRTKINTGAFGFASIADLHKGQRVEVDSDLPKTAGVGSVDDNGRMNGAKKIKLQQQTLRGTVSNISGANFTLTVAADSAFAKLAGTTTVQVVNNGAQMKTTVSNGATLRVRGLLFADAAGNYSLVAGRITTP